MNSEGSVEIRALKQRIANEIARQLLNPFDSIEIEQLTPLAGGLFAVYAIIQSHIICECLATDIRGRSTVFFTVDFVRHYVLQPALETYTAEHPCITGV